MATLLTGLSITPTLQFKQGLDKPMLQVIDSTDYPALGKIAANIKGIFKVEFIPTKQAKILLYNKNSFISPDIIRVSTDTALLKLCCYTGEYCGEMLVRYSIIETIAGVSTEFYKDFSYKFCYVPFVMQLDLLLDCYKATLKSVDNTQYNVANSTNTEISYTHRVVSATEYDSGEQEDREIIVESEDLFTELYTSTVTTTQSYAFAQTPTGVFTVSQEAIGNATYQVQCFLNDCGLLCVLKALSDKLREGEEENHQTNLAKFLDASALYSQYRAALRCKKTAIVTKIVADFVALTGYTITNDNCNCVQPEAEVTNIIPTELCEECYN
jgi:hypothetical protein